jgi:predicted RNase H-like HicB family nuclease
MGQNVRHRRHAARGWCVADRSSEVQTVEHVIQLHIEKLPEGVYLATSEEVQGLVAQGRTIQETLEIARDVAKKLLEAQSDGGAALPSVRETFDYPLIVAT